MRIEQELKLGFKCTVSPETFYPEKPFSSKFNPRFYIQA